jgi:hypothetical protein
MKKALINPLEIMYGNEEGTEQGYRICEVTETEFEVASPLFWIEVADDTNQQLKYYDPNDQQLKDVLPPPTGSE